MKGKKGVEVAAGRDVHVGIRGGEKKILWRGGGGGEEGRGYIF